MAGPRRSPAGSRRRRSPPDRRARRVVAERTVARRRGRASPQDLARGTRRSPPGVPAQAKRDAGRRPSNRVRGVEASPRAAFRGRARRGAPPQADVQGRFALAPLSKGLSPDVSFLAVFPADLASRPSQPTLAAGLCGRSSTGDPAASASASASARDGSRAERGGRAGSALIIGSVRAAEAADGIARIRPRPPSSWPNHRPDRVEAVCCASSAAAPAGIWRVGRVLRRQSQSWSIGISGRSAGGIGWSRSADGLTQASF